jgi:predicted alpha/beta-fold hydrolase
MNTRSKFLYRNLRNYAVVSIMALQLCAHIRLAAAEDLVAANTSSAASRGLYWTISGYLKVDDVQIQGLRNLKLSVSGFRQKVPVKAIIQRGPAPLVVVLLGISGKADTSFSQLWPSWLGQAGYHVLFFDSTFRPSFVDISHHGVTGNLWVESERVALIIQAFLKLPELNGNITKQAVVGVSYGGLQALILGKLATQGKLPFRLDAIRAYSPPCKLDKTAQLIDAWFENDRSNYTLAELSQKMAGHKPVGSAREVPFSDSMMRAAIAAVFRAELVDVIVRNDHAFKLNQLPRGDEFDDAYVRRDHAATWGFEKFARNMAYPYWQNRVSGATVEQLITATHLCPLLNEQPENSGVILAEDDPFNATDDVAELKSCPESKRVVWLAEGGHVGYIAEPATRAQLLKIFDPLRESAIQIKGEPVRATVRK